MELENPEFCVISSVPRNAGLTSDRAASISAGMAERDNWSWATLICHQCQQGPAGLGAWRAIMRLELVNLEQCHLSLSQILTVFNSITESQDLQFRSRKSIFTTRYRDIYNCDLVEVRRVMLFTTITSCLTQTVILVSQGLIVKPKNSQVRGLPEVSWEP